MPLKFISLKCQNCGANLQIYDDMIGFACGYCGTEMLAERRGGTISVKRVSQAIQKVQIGTDKTAAELALIRLSSELCLKEAEINQLLLKGEQVGFEAGEARKVIVWVGLVVSLTIGGAVGGRGGFLVFFIIMAGVIVCHEWIVRDSLRTRKAECRGKIATACWEAEEVRQRIARNRHVVNS